jgi:hypothetical protein
MIKNSWGGGGDTTMEAAVVVGRDMFTFLG